MYDTWKSTPLPDYYHPEPPCYLCGRPGDGIAQDDTGNLLDACFEHLGEGFTYEELDYEALQDTH